MCPNYAHMVSRQEPDISVVQIVSSGSMTPQGPRLNTCVADAASFLDFVPVGVPQRASTPQNVFSWLAVDNPRRLTKIQVISMC